MILIKSAVFWIHPHHILPRKPREIHVLKPLCNARFDVFFNYPGRIMYC